MSVGVFPDAHDFSIHRSKLIDKSTNIINTDNSHTVNVNAGGSSGLQILLDASTPGALHDSSARWPPPVCHPGTRKEYIDKITGWGLDSTDRVGRVLWMQGPAGVGKSAVAQSCAEALRDNLGATFFFSRPNSRDNPTCLFTTISYQLATRNKSFRRILDTMIHDDPTLVTKSIKQQFQDLIVTPLQELKTRGEDIGERVIIVDGLDECGGADAQCDIIDIVVASVRAKSTPFLWVVFSRPEPHIVGSFESDDVPTLVLPLELPVSRAIDSEIMLYLTDELEKVRKRNDLSPSWLSEEDIWVIVDLSAGLFIYAATVVRYIGERDSPGPEDQLRVVLALATQPVGNSPSGHPLSKLDIFYTLIMQRVPAKTLLTVQKILLATTFSRDTSAVAIANLVGLSEPQFRNACRALHSVLRIYGRSPKIRFYHASFMEFLEDPERSGRFCVRSDCAVALRSELLEKLNKVHALGSSARRQQDLLVTWPWVGGGATPYQYALNAFFILAQSIPLDAQTITALIEFKYAMIPLLWEHHASPFGPELNADRFLQNIPVDFRHKIIRPLPWILFHPALITKPTLARWCRPYILGQGENKALCWQPTGGTGSYISRYPNRWVVNTKFIETKIMDYIKKCPRHQ